MSQSTLENTMTKKETPCVPKGFSTCSLDMHRTSFSKKLQFTEIGAEEMDKKVISSGAKMVIGENIPIWFKAPITQATALMETHCFPFGKRVWLIPNSKMDMILGELNLLRKQFNFNKTKLQFGYEDFIEEHAVACDQNPKLPKGFGNLIRNQHYPWSYVESQLEFNFKANVNVEEELTNGFLNDVAKESREHLQTIMATAKANKAYPKITMKNVNRLLSLKDRMLSVLILEPKAQYVIDVIDQFTSSYKAPFEKGEVRQLINVLHLMINKELFLEMGELEDLEDTRSPYTLKELQSDLTKNIQISI